ncbi:hypothetical protein VTN49DRAFT_3217 [Thermomyces lanuginosus]|uniref:uncharacterized protein n=1 Tax=Thermomyces lanuginosus TaxID=5541 RepID=UPI0037425095
MEQQIPPNIDPTEDKGPKIMGVLWALTGFTTLVVAARLYIRLVMLRSFGLDDYLIAAGMLMNFAFCAVTTTAVINGLGKHLKLIDPNKMEMVLLLNNLSFLFGILAFTIPKLAIAALLNRILNRNKFHRIMLWFLTGLAGAVSCICIVVLFTMCDPPEAMWKPRLQAQGAPCRDQRILVDYAIFTGAISAFVDLFLAIYPSTVLMKLNMSLRKKLALCGALGLGSLASAMAIIKCVQLPGLMDKSDFTYSTADLVLWTCIEACVVAIASCIPTLQPLLELILGKRAMGSSGRGTNDRSKNSTFNSSSYSAKRKESIGFTAVESQESFLGGNQMESQNVHQLSQIRRTDNVTVNYERRPGMPGGNKGPTSW